MGAEKIPTLSSVKITGYSVTDLRFPTSLDGVGSDAMHVGTNGSHPYIKLQTNQPGIVGEGIVSFSSFAPTVALAVTWKEMNI